MELMKYRLRLIEGAGRWWRWSSMRFLMAGGSIQTALLTFPAQLMQYIPQWVLQALSVFALTCIVLAGIGRVTVLEKPNEPEPPPPAQ